jgi:hypothetical protein
MTPEKWNVYLSVSTVGETWTDPKDTPDNTIRMHEFCNLFASLLPAPARVLCPGGMTEAVHLTQMGYEVYALQTTPEAVAWLTERGVEAHLRDAHDLDYIPGLFDGYFSVQVHEHWISPFIHIGEVRYCMRDGGIVFVDVCGTKESNPANDLIWHVNLPSNENTVRDQWQFWGFDPIWKGPLVGATNEPGGDGRPQWAFRKLPAGHPDFKHSGYIDRIMRARAAL